MGVGERVSVLAGSPSMAATWTEAMRQRKLSPKRLLPTLPGHRSAMRRSRAPTYGEHAGAPRRELLCKPDSSFYSASQYHRRCRNTAPPPDSISGSTERWRVP